MYVLIIIVCTVLGTIIISKNYLIRIITPYRLEVMMGTMSTLPDIMKANTHACFGFVPSIQSVSQAVSHPVLLYQFNCIQFNSVVQFWLKYTINSYQDQVSLKF